MFQNIENINNAIQYDNGILLLLLNSLLIKYLHILYYKSRKE